MEIEIIFCSKKRDYVGGNTVVFSRSALKTLTALSVARLAAHIYMSCLTDSPSLFPVVFPVSFTRASKKTTFL